MPGKLYLVPSTIGDTPVESVLPAWVLEKINGIRNYIAENERSARRMLIRMGIEIPIDELKFFILNKHTPKEQIPEYLKLLEQGDVGLLSEAGTPAVADPGSDIVSLAHQNNYKVVPLVGPSSILLAVMASGLNGQNFAFVGYLPVNKHERMARLRQLEKRSNAEGQSQAFIETPYRNNTLLDDILAACNHSTMLCIAANITTEEEYIRTMNIATWKKKKPDLNKIPCIFILHRY